VKAELEEVEGKLREAKADAKESERDRRLVETVEALKRTFSGVRGRLVDLVKVPQRKHNLAVTVALGRHMDAIVVDDDKTGTNLSNHPPISLSSSVYVGVVWCGVNEWSPPGSTCVRVQPVGHCGCVSTQTRKYGTNHSLRDEFPVCLQPLVDPNHTARGQEQADGGRGRTRAGKECIGYLKAQRHAPLSFIPLASIRAQAPDERLRSLGGTAQLVVDVLQFDSALERALFFALGSTLVCDTHAEAKRIGYGAGGGGGSARHKVLFPSTPPCARRRLRCEMSACVHKTSPSQRTRRWSKLQDVTCSSSEAHISLNLVSARLVGLVRV
jgi:hypothetical protein